MNKDIIWRTFKWIVISVFAIGGGEKIFKMVMRTDPLGYLEMSSLAMYDLHYTED